MLALAPDDRAKQFLLAGEMRVNRRLGDTGVTRDCVHADRAETAFQKHPFCRSKDALRLAGGRGFVTLAAFNRAGHSSTNAALDNY